MVQIAVSPASASAAARAERPRAERRAAPHLAGLRHLCASGLTPVDRVDPGPVDLGDVAAVGERQGDAAEHHRVGRQPFEFERRDAEADQVEQDQQRDPAHHVDVDGGHQPNREQNRHAHRSDQRDQQPEREHDRFDDQEDPRVEPERAEPRCELLRRRANPIEAQLRPHVEQVFPQPLQLPLRDVRHMEDR